MASVGNLSPSLEELSLKKQLPLRQQKDKPVLKYSSAGGSTSSTTSSNGPHAEGRVHVVGSGPIQLFSDSHIHTVRQPRRPGPVVNSSSSHGTRTPTTSPYTHRPVQSPLHRFSTNSTYVTQSQPQPSVKASRNPYARPISAKDIQPPDDSESITGILRKNSATSLTGSTSSSSAGSCNGYVITAAAVSGNPVSAIQTNSFMRPRSSVPRESKSSNAYFEQQHTSPTNIQVSEGSYVAPTNGFQVAYHLPPNSRHDYVAVREPNGTIKVSVAAPKPPNEMKVKTVSTSTSAASAKVCVGSAMPKPGTAVTQRLGSAQSRSDFGVLSRPSSAARAMARVRNLNYTPTKPYKDIIRAGTPKTHDSQTLETDDSKLSSEKMTDFTPQTDEKDTALVAGDQGRTKRGSSTKWSTSATATVTATATPIMTTTRMTSASGTDLSGSKHVSPAHATSMPHMSGTSSTAVSHAAATVYYRKASKAEEVLHDLKKRSRADGAPASPMKTSEPLAASDEDDGEWEDEEDEDSDAEGPDSERLPGDGEDFDNDDADDEDDILDGIDDDDEYTNGDSDGDSDGYSISTAGSRKGSAVRLKSATKRMLGLSLKDGADNGRSRPTTAKSRPVSAVSTLSSTDSDLQPALTASLFANVPPTVNFVDVGEKVEQLPWEIRKLLKWKMSPITPNVVKNCIARSGFRASKKNHDWIGYWGKHMKSQGFKTIREYQKVNHVPGSFQIGRKDRLWRNLSRMQVLFGKREFNFFPQTYVLPYDMKLLKRAWEDGGSKQKWIIKPPASARGIGIRVVHKWNQIPKKRPVIVQRYLGRPYLINGHKFDMRLYVYVTSFDPLRLYIYDDGLARFASCKYSYSMKNLSNRYMHLTNYSINKKNMEYESNTDDNVCQGHKWGLKALWGYMKKQGINTNVIWENIKDLVIKTLLCAESSINTMIKSNCKTRYVCHELFGFDVMLDENFRPWIIEVNISPSLHSNSQLDINIKGGMIKDLLNVAGFMIPDKNDVTVTGFNCDHSRYMVPNGICMDKRLWPAQVAPDERAKHAYFCQRFYDEAVQSTILDTLTPDDVRILVESVDEDSRRGNFQRIFPSPTSYKYLRFLETPRYYNLLLNMWIQKYHRMEARGINMLEQICQKGIILESHTEDPKHQWCPPSSHMARDTRVVSAPAAGQPGSLLRAKKKRSKKLLNHCSSTSSLTSASSTPASTPAPS